MTDAASGAVNARMAELRQKFVVRCTGELTQMRAALAQLADAPRDNDAGLEQIRHLAHKACGTGGTLGFSSLADAAAALEQLADSCISNPASSVAARAEISARIDRLAAELASL